MEDKHTALVFEMLGEGLTPLQAHERLLKAVALAASMISDGYSVGRSREYKSFVDTILSRYEDSE